MRLKFGLNYKIKIQVNDTEEIEVKYPISCEFSIDRNTLSQANTASFTLINLAENTRNKIYKDQYQTTVYKGVEFYAGYGQDLSLLFKGNIKRAYSERTGTEFYTKIEAYDGGYAFVNGYSARSFNAGTPKNDILDSLISDLPKLKKGVVGKGFEDDLKKGNVYNDNTMQLLRAITNEHTFVDNERVNILLDEECLRGNVVQINANTGLLGTPLKEESSITFNMIFEPRLLVGQALYLESTTEKNFNGNYKVIGFKHSGNISGSVASKVITSVNLWYGKNPLVLVN